MLKDEESTTTESTTATPMFNAGRLDEKMARKLRALVGTMLTERYQSDEHKLAEALEMSVSGLQNVIKKKTNGSMATAIKVSKLAGTPLEDIVGETLAKMGRVKATTAERDAQEAARNRRPAPPPPAPISHPAASATGLHVGEKVIPVALTRHQLDELRKGHFNTKLVAQLVDEFDALTARTHRLERHILASLGL